MSSSFLDIQTTHKSISNYIELSTSIILNKCLVDALQKVLYNGGHYVLGCFKQGVHIWSLLKI